jgi:hypothetical protein
MPTLPRALTKLDLSLESNERIFGLSRLYLENRSLVEESLEKEKKKKEKQDKSNLRSSLGRSE